MSSIASTGTIERSIRLARGQKVIFDFDLATLYGVTTSNLNKAVDRNRDRFPDDFMLFIPAKEAECLIFQTGISKQGRGGRRKPVRAFTQEGVAMLSSILKSKPAIQVNVEIMRTFVRLRSILASHTDLTQRLDDLERHYDEQFRGVFEAIRELMTPTDPPRKPIGFDAI
jgi:hypothetical protein